jgi:uncharacterized protein YycO
MDKIDSAMRIGSQNPPAGRSAAQKEDSFRIDVDAAISTADSKGPPVSGADLKEGAPGILRAGTDFIKNGAGSLAFSIPSASALKMAFMAALQAGGVSKGNPHDCECVTSFREVFDHGIAKPGDIILVGSNVKPELSLLDSLVPGNYSHAGMYLGRDEKGVHKSIDAWVPAAQIRDIEWWPESYNRWSILRPVKADGSELSEAEMQKVLDFAKSAEGCSYNFGWTNRDLVLPVDPEKTSFYCSQLAWASYYHGAGIDIDANPGPTMQYASGVAPQELRDAPNVKVVAEKDFSSDVLSKETFMRLGGGIAGIAASHTLISLALGSSPIGVMTACSIIAAEALAGAVGIWCGKILYEALRGTSAPQAAPQVQAEPAPELTASRQAEPSREAGKSEKG